MSKHSDPGARLWRDAGKNLSGWALVYTHQGWEEPCSSHIHVFPLTQELFIHQDWIPEIFGVKKNKRNTFWAWKAVLAAVPLLCLWLIFSLHVTGSDSQMVKKCSRKEARRTGWLWANGGSSSRPFTEDFHWSNNIMVNDDWIRHDSNNGSSRFQTWHFQFYNWKNSCLFFIIGFIYVFYLFISESHFVFKLP